MSLGDILKNVYSFLEVLQSANTPAACEWNEESFNNARQWAAYCEQVLLSPLLTSLITSNDYSALLTIKVTTRIL